MPSTSKMTDVPKKKKKISLEIDLKTHENQKKGGIEAKVFCREENVFHRCGVR